MFKAPVIAMATLALALAGTAIARAGDPVTVRAMAGQSYDGWIVEPAETHEYVLEDFAPQLFSVSVKAVRGSDLSPALTLEDPVSTDVTASLAPYTTTTSRTVTVKRAPFPSGEGRYVLRVGGRNASVGPYRLKITAKVQRTIKGEAAVVVAPATVAFFVPAEATATLKVTPKSPGSLSPAFTGVTGPSCLIVDLQPGTRTGQAYFTAPVTGRYTVTIAGAGSTSGAFDWVAKVKSAKPSKFPVRVNAGAAYFPDPGPEPAVTVTSTGQDLAGWANDGVDLCWREIRTTGNGSQSGKNSVICTDLKGDNARKIANNFATDAAPPAAGFALGPTHVAVVADGALRAMPRSGGSDVALDADVGTVLRVLVDKDTVYVLRADALRAYPLQGGGFDPLPAAAGTLRDVRLGGRGLVYAVETGGNVVEVRTISRAGADDALLAALDPAVAVTALAARGPDVFVATDDGAGAHRILRIPSCDGGTPVQIFAGGVVSALAVDEFNVYGVENDPVDGPWVRQFPRGGGVAQVLVRGSGSASCVIDGTAVGAAASQVFFLADASGTPTFLRVKRR